MLCVNLHIGVIRYFSRLAATHNLLITAVATEFGNNLVMLLYISLFLALFQAEYLVIKEQEEASAAEDAAVALEAQEQEVAEAAKPTGKGKKSAKKKKAQRKAKQMREEGEN